MLTYMITLHKRQHDLHCKSSMSASSDLHFSSVRLRDLLYDQEPQPVTLLSCICIAHHVMRRTVQSVDLFFRSARPVVLRRPTRVAVLPVGYQNGFGVARAQGSGLGALLRRWLAARRRTVRVNGQRARILGAIGAIETVVDVTDLKCSAGDPAVFDIDPLYARGFVREYR